MTDEALRQTFARQQYAVMRSVIADPLLGFLWRYVRTRAANDAFAPGDHDVPGAACAYADTVMEHVLERLRPAVEQLTGLRLYPTYSYVRVYRTGDALEPHTDRESCEISVSVNLGQDPPASWPLWIRGAAGPDAIHLHPGDALLYRGIEREHWRERYDGVMLGQVFLHYVDQAGPHAAWRFDKRDGLDLSTPLPI
ncbi:MAG TPA: hypothetical protein VKI43_10285 [Vicinamibacterales bacterium]|nr:hypothetical protein [Vicinamibacterales bacterium]